MSFGLTKTRQEEGRNIVVRLAVCQRQQLIENYFQTPVTTVSKVTRWCAGLPESLRYRD